MDELYIESVSPVREIDDITIVSIYLAVVFVVIAVFVLVIS